MSAEEEGPKTKLSAEKKIETNTKEHTIPEDKPASPSEPVPKQPADIKPEVEESATETSVKAPQDANPTTPKSSAPSGEPKLEDDKAPLKTVPEVAEASSEVPPKAEESKEDRKTDGTNVAETEVKAMEAKADTTAPADEEKAGEEKATEEKLPTPSAVEENSQAEVPKSAIATQDGVAMTSQEEKDPNSASQTDGALESEGLSAATTEGTLAIADEGLLATTTDDMAHCEEAMKNEIEVYEKKLFELKAEAYDLKMHKGQLLQRVIDLVEQGETEVGHVTLATVMEEIDDETNIENVRPQYHAALIEVASFYDSLAKKQTDCKSKITRLNSRVNVEDNKAEELRNAYKEFRRDIAKTAVNPRTGKPIPAKWILQKEQEEEELEQEVEMVRLKNIHLTMKLKKLESLIKEKEKLGEGLHLIDFEQLKIENQTLNEKIEERNDELHKLKKKATTTVQVLTHIKEKLQFVTKENEKLNSELKRKEDEMTCLRDALTKAKRKRDKIRAERNSVKNQAFVTSELLLEDYDARKRRVIDLEEKLEQVNSQIATKLIR